MRRGARAAVAAVMAAVAVVAPVDAAAPPDALRLSVDGITWTPSIDVPLFDPTHVWVPGDSETVHLWAENNTADEASLTIDFTGSALPSLLDAGGAALTAAVGGASRTIDVDADARLVDVGELDPHERVQVSLTFTLAATAGNDAQRLSAPVALVVTLRQESPAAGAPGVTPPPARPDPIPSTGGAVTPLLLVATIALLAGGAFVGLRRVRHER